MGRKTVRIKTDSAQSSSNKYKNYFITKILLTAHKFSVFSRVVSVRAFKILIRSSCL